MTNKTDLGSWDCTHLDFLDCFGRECGNSPKYWDKKALSNHDTSEEQSDWESALRTVFSASFGTSQSLFIW